VESPLLAKGIVLEAEGQRYVLCALDWCEICNGAYDSMRSKIAVAAGTEASHVALQTVHQHTAPLVDMSAQKLLAELGTAKGVHLDPEVYNAIEQRLATAVKESVAKLEPFDQIAASQAKVDRVASSRRCRDKDGNVRPRMSSCQDPFLIALPEGTIDPFLKTITFARAGKPLVRLHYYATHPQSSYGGGRGSSDIVGDAREELERKEGVFQIYFTGCGGDIALGKYNDGSKKARQEMASRLLVGMEASVAATKLGPIGPIQWRTCPVVFPPRDDGRFAPGNCLATMKQDASALTGLVGRLYNGGIHTAFRQRNRQPIELTSLQIGDIYIVHLPGEAMIDFQLFAQSLKPSGLVAVAAYGDCCTGYICTEQAFRDGGYEPTDANVKPESETLLKKAIASLLGVER
jgi:hypothetical protein